MIDLEKRKKIMARSIALGHCICNPKDPCPCDLFKKKNICLCAGERESDAADNVPLTQFVENAGCASKISQADLKKALAGLPHSLDPNVLVSAETCDDAGIYKIDEERALVQTVDVFTPIVDDAYLFGRIAAANSVSDVYAMGGRPLTALSIVAFPIERLSPRVLNQMMQGGVEALAECGTALLGGHSIKDKEIKFGFAVTGLVHPQRIITNDKARPGDVLILTKPIGTGIISFAAQIGRGKPEWTEAIGKSMARLNKSAAEIMIEAGVLCATDVTGFGLLGHLGEMAVQSNVAFEIKTTAIPVFDGVRELILSGVISGGIERNREYSGRFLKRGPSVTEEAEAILCDPQTSGGLLMCVPEQKSCEVLQALKDKGDTAAAMIGRVLPDKEPYILLS